MKNILILSVSLFVFTFSSIAQSNLFIGKTNSFSISTTFEKLENENNIFIVSPFYSVEGYFDIGLNFGYSIKEPNVLIVNPLAFTHLLNNKTTKNNFNLAYGLGYQYESSTLSIDNNKIESTSNYFEMYYLLYYSMQMDNLIIQPQLNVLYFLGETNVESSYLVSNSTESKAHTFANIKLGLAFIYNTSNINVHFIPNIYLDNKGKNFSFQIGLTI